MSVEPDVKRVIVEALRKEGGVATGDRLIYAYIRIRERFRNSKELIGFVKENLADQVEVVEEILYPYRDDVEKAVFLRLRDFPRDGEAMTVFNRRRDALNPRWSDGVG